jgi:periplasmic divalent cation tolerance protein
MGAEQHVQVSTTTDSREAAEVLARSAVEARVAACGQVLGPITSVYRWQDGIEDATEWLVLFKTTAERSGALVDHVRERHSYDVPEVVVTPITGGNPAYLAWLGEETAGG